MTQVQLTLTPEQAYAVCDALDLYSRVCIGQLEEVAELLRAGIIPVAVPPNLKRVEARIEQVEEITELLNRCKDVLGYPRNGSNGIGHSHVHASGHRAYEVKKVLTQALAVHRNPSPQFKGVDYDGLGPRYTQDPAPVAVVLG